MTKFKLLLLVFLLIVSSLTFIPVMADSGWDNDYGGSSSWGGSSSSDHSWSSSSHDHSYRDHSSVFDKVLDIITLIIMLIIIILAIIQAIKDIINAKKTRKKVIELIDAEVKFKVGDYTNSFDTYNNHTIGDFDHEIQKYFPDLNEGLLIEELFHKFVAVQSAWMNFDYDGLKRLCSDELYNSYKSDLEVLKLSNGKNVMNDFLLIAGNIDGIKEENNTIIIDVYLSMSFLDFVVNTKKRRIIKGDTAPMFCKYKLKYIVSKNTGDLICPNCGAKLKPGVKQCKYCNSTINNNYGDFVLSVKEKI